MATAHPYATRVAEYPAMFHSPLVADQVEHDGDLKFDMKIVRFGTIKAIIDKLPQALVLRVS